jgi:Ca2+-binding EF-hand superfamily protein
MSLDPKEFVESQKRKEERDRRRQSLTSIVVFDTNLDGFVTAAEIEEALRAEQRQRGDDTWVTRRRDELMQMDADGDGRISLREAAENPPQRHRQGSYRHHNMSQSERLEKMLALDIDGDGALSDKELEAILRASFAVLDADADGRLTQTEKQVLHDRQRRQQERAKLEEAARKCLMPKPAEEDDIAFLGIRSASAFSTASVSGSGKSTHAAEVSVSALDKKNYLVLASQQPVIWDMISTTSRISQVVVFGPRGQEASVQAGVRGVPKDRVVFLAVEDCLPRLSSEVNARDGAMPNVAAALELFVGRAPEVLQGVDLLHETTLLRGGFVIVRHPSPQKMEKPLIGFDAEVWQEKITAGKTDLRFIAAADVVSPAKVIDTAVLPGAYGLAKLVHDGAIEKVPTGRFSRVISGGNSSVTIIEGSGQDSITINGVPAGDHAGRRVPIFEYRLKREIPGLNVRAMGLSKLLVPLNVKVGDDIGVRECTDQKGPAGERVFAMHADKQRQKRCAAIYRARGVF